MGITGLGWEHELVVVDRTMKAISGVTDPEELVGVYWENIGELMPINDFVALSRRNVEPPDFLVTRASRFLEEFNPWTQRERLPRLSGGILGEIVYANKPVIIEDLSARLRENDPGYFYLRGYHSLYAVPQYDNGQGLNVSVMLLPPGKTIDHRILPMLHWQSGLFGRGTTNQGNRILDDFVFSPLPVLGERSGEGRFPSDRRPLSLPLPEYRERSLIECGCPGTTNLVLKNDLAKALSTLDRELQAVGDIQRSLLPQHLPEIAGFDLAAHYRTSARCGGDYYDFFRSTPPTSKTVGACSSPTFPATEHPRPC